MLIGVLPAHMQHSAHLHSGVSPMPLPGAHGILFGHVDIDVNLFDFCSTSTRGHQFKLFKHHTNHCTRSSFFCERIINVWNSLPSTVIFSSLNCFKQSIGSVDFSVFLKCS